MRHTAATKAKLSAMRKGERNPFYGRKHSKATKEKISKASRRYNLTTRRYAPSASSVKIPEGEALGYLAGLVDGEGSVRFRRGRPFMAIYNNSRVMMDWVLREVGGTITGVDHRGRVPGYKWAIGAARDVYLICSAVLPLLTAKADEAKEVIAFLERKYGTEVFCGRED